MSCMCLSVVTMGYSRDLLDVCFGDQLEVTLEYLGDIRVLVDLCLKVLF